jgi:hypothetical protein
MGRDGTVTAVNGWKGIKEDDEGDDEVGEDTEGEEEIEDEEPAIF